MKLCDDLVSSSESISENVYSLSANLAYLYTMAHLISGQNPAGIVGIANIISSDECFIMPPPLGAGGIMFSGCPSVRPSEAWNTSFDLYMGPLVHPTNRNRFTACPSVRPERFPGICRRTHGGNGLKFYMLMYLDHLQNWLVYDRGLLIFLILALFWLSETGQIWGFRAFPGERMEEMAWNFARWCILTTFRTD